MKYKANFQFPTEQYGYLAVELAGTPEEIVRAYKEFKAAWGKPEAKENGMGMLPGVGLDGKKFMAAVDSYLENGVMDSEDYAAMSSEQWRVIQEIKKSQKRIAYKNNKITK